MRLQKYMIEKFAGADMINSVITEIFKNPDTKEMKGLKDRNQRGLRFIVDVESKDVYFTGSEMIHDLMIKAIMPKLPDLNYTNYYRHGDGMERYILGVMIGNEIESDSIRYIMTYVDKDTLVEMLDNLKMLNTYNLSWISKWMSVAKVNEFLNDTIETLERKLL